MSLSYILGIIGMVLVLTAFLLEQKGKWSEDDLMYDLFNFIGSGLLVVYAVAGNALPFIVLNTLWGLYSLYDVVVDLRRDYGKKHRLFASKRT